MYRTTRKANDYWSVLGDPKYKSDDEIKRGEVLRASMTYEDWGEEQLCIFCDCATGVALADIREGFETFYKAPDCDIQEAHRYVYENTMDILEKLLKKGFIEDLTKQSTTDEMASRPI